MSQTLSRSFINPYSKINDIASNKHHSATAKLQRCDTTTVAYTVRAKFSLLGRIQFALGDITLNNLINRCNLKRVKATVRCAFILFRVYVTRYTRRVHMYICICIVKK